MTAILYRNARGDFVERDPYVVRFFTSLKTPSLSAPASKEREAEFYYQGLNSLDELANQEIALAQVVDFCERHHVPYPTFLPPKGILKRTARQPIQETYAPSH